MNAPHRIILTLSILLLAGALSVQGLIPDDADGDGVPDADDLCPAVDASGFDRDGDGCIDDGAGARHVEYWGWVDSVITYVINELGAPGVSGTSDNAAVQAAFAAWTSIPGTEQDAVFGGTTPQAVANGLDQVNLVTFSDATYPFGYSTLAVGLTASFEADTLIGGRLYRPGEIFDADMIFNPLFTFRTTSGPGIHDIQSVATHEAGHLFGISHCAVRTSTMFYVLPPGTNARSLEDDDRAVFRKAYGDANTMATSSRLQGTVTNGQTSAPVAGAVVFVINEATGDTSACDFTMPDGTFTFVGLADGDYFVSIHPLDGTAPVSFMTAANVSAFLFNNVQTNFLPESYDAAESNSDNPADMTAVAVSAGTTATADIVTNIDGTPPIVVEATPADGTPDAAIDAAYVIEFSERIKVGTVSAAFSFRDDLNAGVAGNIVVLRDDSVLVFTPSAPLKFATAYTLRIDTDLTDLAGNALATDFVLNVVTEVEPPVSITSLAPNKGVVGNTIVINGRGFDPGATVTFNGVPAVVLQSTPTSMLAKVPEAATTGSVVVTNPDLEASNALVFTVLSGSEVARGYETGSVPLPATPHAIALGADGVYAYVATTGGVDVIVVDPEDIDYLARTTIPDAGKIVDVAATPDGRRVYAVNETAQEFVEIMTDPTSGLLLHTILASRPLGATPKGIVVDPFGYRAYVSTDEAAVHVWDIRLGSATYQQQVGVLHTPDGIALTGEMAISPGGDRLLALGGSGEVFFYSLGPDTLLSRVATGTDLRHLAVDPQGQRAYVAGGNGNLAVLSIAANPFFVQSIVTGGSLRGLDTTPAGLYLYATDREIDVLKVVDLDESHAAFRSVIATAPHVANPVDAAISGDGVYAFSVLQGDGANDARMAVTTIGIGPTIESMFPTGGQPGTQVVFTVNGINEGTSSVAVSFNGVVTTPTMLPNQTTVIATVPAGATSGPARVIITEFPSPTEQSSNPMPFAVLAPSGPNNIRYAGALQPNTPEAQCDYMTPALAFSPFGDYLYTGCGGTNEVKVYDIRTGSPSLHKIIGAFGGGAFTGYPVADIALTADGKVAFVAGGSVDNTNQRRVQTFYADPNDPRFLERGPAVTLPDVSTPLVSTSPNNSTLLVFVETDPEAVVVMDATNVASGSPPNLVNNVVTGDFVNDIAHHPSSRAAYLGQRGGTVRVVNTDPTMGTFGFGIGTVTTGLTELWALDVSPDGSTLYAYGYFFTDYIDYRVISIDVTNPHSPGATPTTCFVNTEVEVVQRQQFRLAPQGDVAVRTIGDIGLLRHDPSCPGGDLPPTLFAQELNEYEFHPHGGRVYMSNQGSFQVAVYDFLAAENLVEVSGNSQTGVINEVLPAALRVRVTSSVPNAALGGIPITFNVLAGGGSIETNDGPMTQAVVATDANGFAQARWRLGSAMLGHSVQALAQGLAGSPIYFSATGTDDPNTLPLTVAEVIPVDGSIDISPSTALLATFSRAIDPASITSSSFYLRVAPAGPALPATFGFTSANRKVSVTPSAALNLATVYEIVLTGAVNAAGGGGALTNPGVSDFTTAAAQPLRLASVWPLSGLVGIPITLAGTGFDPVFSANTVMFNGVAATPFAGTSDALQVVVPINAISGPVTVVKGIETSNAINFAVLQRSTSTIDDVVATIGTGTGTKSVALTGDGALCYSLGTDGDIVIPINLENETTYPSIPVGDQPVAIAMHPDGSLGYVANFGSGTVSAIGVDPANSVAFNTVVETIPVGTSPLDVAAAPDGDRLAVANAGTGDVSIIDTDETSVAYNQVVATIGTGTGTKSVAISGDGTLYVGTSTQILAMQAPTGSAYEVVATIGTGTGTKSVAISGDGTLLFALTDGGNLLVVDIGDGSPSENSVVATIGTGTGTKSVALSGDGTLLYLVQENTDEVLILALDVIPGVGVTTPDGAAAPFRIETRQVGTLVTGSDPSDVVVDPSGSGRVLVSNAGSKTVTLYGVGFGPVNAYFRLTPRTLNIKSRGKYMSGVIQVPPPHTVREIDLSTVRVFDTVYALPGKEKFGDKTGDGIEDVTVRFCRQEFIDALPANGEFVDVMVKGTVGGDEFIGTDVLRVLRPTIKKPHALEVVQGGYPYTIEWESPSGLQFEKVNIEWTPTAASGGDDDDEGCGGGDDEDDEDEDDFTLTAMPVDTEEESVENFGDEWRTIAFNTPNTGSFLWLVPNEYSASARLRITLVSRGKKAGESIVPFVLEMPVPVRLKSIDVAMEGNAAVMRWETSMEVGMSGYDVVRSESKDGWYETITKEIVPASGSVSGGRYEYRDETIRANRTYWYKLREVEETGPGAEYGPYSVTFRLVNQLDQNVPNPFNPTTTIGYSIAGDNSVNLTIYDVAGRKVRTLVNEPQRAAVYRVKWDGMNESGVRVASGVYFYKLVAGKFTQTRKMVLLK